MFLVTFVSISRILGGGMIYQSKYLGLRGEAGRDAHLILKLAARLSITLRPKYFFSGGRVFFFSNL